MIVVTGATGALNGATLRHLLHRVPPEDLAVVVRDPADASPFRDRGILVRTGDYADPHSLPAAFVGADQLLLVSAPDPSVDVVTLHRNAIDAAKAAGVGRIFYTSHQGAHTGTPFKSGRDHALTERMLADSGMAWTSLRNGFYAHYLSWLLGPWRDSGEIRVPADGPVSWTDRADVAEAAAVLLLADTPLDGPITLTAAAAPTFEEIAAAATEVTQRSVARTLIATEEWKHSLTDGGVSAYMADFLFGVFQAAERGMLSGTSPDLARLLGREPRTVRDVLVNESA